MSYFKELVFTFLSKSFRQLLLDCGIGVTTAGSGDLGSEPVVSQHRVLLFCQMKSMLDIVEKDLLKYDYYQLIINKSINIIDNIHIIKKEQITKK